MCGIAGLIHRGKSSDVGRELQDMLQALKHRGPDSTGYALYGEGNNQGDYIMRFKVGENVAEGSSAVKEDKSVYDERRKQVDKHIRELGGSIVNDAQLTPYSFRYCIKYDKDLMEFSKKIESVEMTEILSLGKSLELVKDIGDAGVVCGVLPDPGCAGCEVAHARTYAAGADLLRLLLRLLPVDAVL